MMATRAFVRAMRRTQRSCRVSLSSYSVKANHATDSFKKSRTRKDDRRYQTYDESSEKVDGILGSLGDVCKNDREENRIAMVNVAIRRMIDRTNEEDMDENIESALKIAAKNGVKPDAMTSLALSTRLLRKGRDVAASELLRSLDDVPSPQVIRSFYASVPFGLDTHEQVALLERILSEERFDAATSLFKILVAEEKATTKHVDVMIRHMTRSPSSPSSSIAEILEISGANGLSLSDSTVTLLLRSFDSVGEEEIGRRKKRSRRAPSMARTDSLSALEALLRSKSFNMDEFVIRGGRARNALGPTKGPSSFVMRDSRPGRLFKDLLRDGLADTRHCSVMLRNCVDSVDAEWVLDISRKHGIEPDAASYYVVLAKIIEDGDERRAASMCERMSASTVFDENAMIPSRRALSEMMKSGRKDVARSHMQQLLQTGTPSSLNKAMDALTTARDRTMALEVLARARAQGIASALDWQRKMDWLWPMDVATTSSNEKNHRSSLDRAKDELEEAKTSTSWWESTESGVPSKIELIGVCLSNDRAENSRHRRQRAIIFDDDQHVSPRRMNIVRARALDGFLRTGRKDLAHELYRRYIDAGVADVVLLNTMLSRFCSNSEDAKAMMRRAVEMGIQTDATSRNILIAKLRFEGRTEDASEWLSSSDLREESKRELHDTSRRDETVSRMNTEEIKSRMLDWLTFKTGSSGFRHAKRKKRELRDRAWTFYRDLLLSGKGNVIHCNMMVRMSPSSALARRALEWAKTHGDIEPDVVTYTTLASQMLKEGRRTEARKMVDEMIARGLPLDEKARRVRDLAAR